MRLSHPFLRANGQAQYEQYISMVLLFNSEYPRQHASCPQVAPTSTLLRPLRGRAPHARAANDAGPRNDAAPACNCGLRRCHPAAPAQSGQHAAPAAPLPPPGQHNPAGPLPPKAARSARGPLPPPYAAQCPRRRQPRQAAAAPGAAAAVEESAKSPPDAPPPLRRRASRARRQRRARSPVATA